MSEEKIHKRDWKEKLSKVYRMVIYRKEDFQEVRSFDLSLGKIYSWMGGVVILLTIGLVSLIFFTPIKRFVPGYGDIEMNQKFSTLLLEVKNLSGQIDAQQTYIGALQRMLKSEERIQTASSFEELQLPQKIGPELNMPISVAMVDAPTSYDEKEIYFVLSDQRIVKPVDGIISSEFEPELKHFGVDILAPKNTPVRSMMDGFIFISGWDLETGYTIGIQHEENILSFYKHNSVLLQEKGTFVSAGEAIAIIGNTGTLSSGPHLHFEMWHNGKPVNPKDFVNFN